MLQQAAQQVQRCAAYRRVEGHRLGVCVGTTQGPIETWIRHQQRLAADGAHRPPLPGLYAPAHQLAELLGARGPLACPSMACASGTAAIGLAMDWLRPDLMQPMMKHWFGYALIITIVLMEAIGMFFIRKITNVSV